MGSERYHRQMLLPGIGTAGQARLAEAAALVVGCGALGTHLADSLTRAGVGHLIMIDRDFVEWTNLQRQVLFDESDATEALPKAEAARRRLERINSDIRITAVVDDVNHNNVERFALETAGRPVDVIVDGLDNFETRFLLNDVAVKHGIPYVYGGAVGTTGMSYVVLPHTAAGDRAWEAVDMAGPCLRCIFEHAPPPAASPTCDTVGVLGPTVGIIAQHQANEALKILTCNWPAVCLQLRQFDTWTNHFHALNVTRAREADDCPCCKQRRFDHLDGKFASSTATLCGRDAVQLRHADNGHAPDLETIAERLRVHGSVTLNAFMLRAQITDNGSPYELTLFPDGRAIIKGTQTPGIARGIYARYIGA